MYALEYVIGLSALKVKCFQPNFTIFLTLFFTNSENTAKSKFRQDTLNILSALKFIFSILRMKSQFQPDFTNNFFTRVFMKNHQNLVNFAQILSKFG
jgi:hypothetical protein